MGEKKKDLTAEQYHQLYLRAFSRLEDLACMAEKAMQELEQLQLVMGDAQDSEN